MPATTYDRRNAPVLVIANDVIPGMSLPVAAPGLRAWGIASGLRQLGHEAEIAINAHVVRRARHSPVPPPLPRGAFVADIGHIASYISSSRPRAVIVTNSNHVEQLGELDGTSLVYDFFAPKVLELSQNPLVTASALELLRQRKLAALSKSDAVIINGAKKQAYVDDWLAQAGSPTTPTAIVNMPLEPMPPAPRNGQPLHAIVAGYIQPWSHPGNWAAAIEPLLTSGRMVLHLIVPNHWGATGGELAPAFRRLAEIDGVRQHGAMEFRDFRALLRSCHVSIDLFAHNPERELAFVTRTGVALSSGVPVLHVPFTEVSPLIASHDAGWLLDGDDTDGIVATLEAAIDSPELLARKRSGAMAVSEVLSPANAVAPLADLLNRLQGQTGR